jgi:hypothetical protein
MGMFKIDGLVEEHFKDEDKDFHNFVKSHIPAILDVKPEDIAILHEFNNVDFVCVDKEGGVYLLECKLSVNPEIKRKVIAQLIDYAVSTFNLNYQDILDRVKSEHFNKIKDFDSSLLERGLKSNLHQNILNIYIVCNELPDELIKSALYIKVGGVGLPIRLVEIKKLSMDGKIMPYIRTINDEGKETASQGFNKEQFLGNFKGDTKATFNKIIEYFLNKYSSNGSFVFGRSGNMIFKIRVGDKVYTIFILTVNGLIGLAGYAYLRCLDKDYLLSYYNRFKTTLTLNSLVPKDMISDSASYKVLKEDPAFLLADAAQINFFNLVDELIKKLS